MSKRMMLKFGICVLYIVSIICAILFKNESIKYAFSAVALVIIGGYNTLDYKSYGKKSSLAFAIMFYCFSASSIAFAIISTILA
ncbi:hypothetical protein C5Q96_06400 [Mogibacterium diversum]|uniref:DUF3953 domain-containing protein n=1 Tax=Mogibacterium diversum TaxID=114527 RepID=A0A2S0L5E2_9FIRM|nr:hypothetical protein C5Q96_06400 [Mogibacterium diversum]